ncbi:MAG TPA: FkbM family methyltransferase [Rariglobus sp.]|nr:FkbM family methyltransferase [Rariglobus sp.]
MAFFRHLLKHPFGNRPGQYLLSKQVKLCHWLMGIGAGTSVEDSGEVAVIKKLISENRRDLVVLDVGANMGQFLNLTVSRLGDRLREIHSFEPAATTFQTLAQNALKHDGVRLNHLGLSRAAGTAQLYYDKENSGLASLTKRDLAFRNISFERQESIQLSTADAYCAEHGISHVNWLKMDVEGHELDVLHGASALFGRNAVDLVTFEFGGCNIDTRTYLRDFYQFFEAQGMQLYRITPSGYFHPVSRYRETEEQFTTVNYVAFRRPAV